MNPEALAALEVKAAQLDAEAVDQLSPLDNQTLDEPVQQGPSNQDMLVFMITGIREVSVAVLQVSSPKKTLADPVVQQLAQVLAPVADKHNINLGETWGAMAVEVTALMVAGPLLWTAYRELDAELAARRAKPVEKPDVVTPQAVSDGE